MRRLFLFVLVAAMSACQQMQAKDRFPDGAPITEWFLKTKPIDVKSLGRRYVITEYGVRRDSTALQTAQIQAVIDRAAADGGGTVVVPGGTFLTGALFFRQGTHLCLEENAVLKGSDDISDFPIETTRMEGQTLRYFTALINADGIDGFTIYGKGTLDGNGLRYWRAFWLRRAVNPKCTNMDEMRPRVVYISNCKNVRIEGVSIKNSPFWSTHYYKCSNVKLLNLRITSPAKPVKAPSTDAVDIDACENFLIKGCYMSVNDDAIALKGGKGPDADKAPENGGNRNILVEDCSFGFCHGVMTCGSESVFDHNILVRRCKVDGVERLLWLKMRPDTPQCYEYITFEDITGNATRFIYVAPWTQFFDMKGHAPLPPSRSHHITMRNMEFACRDFFDVKKSDQYRLSDFTFENLRIEAENPVIDTTAIDNFTIKNVRIN